MFQKPRGTRDFLPEEMKKRRFVENKLREVFERYGYDEILTPTFESFELIAKKTGEEIRKQLYVFKDHGGREMALRPEMTSPVVRFYLNELKNLQKPLRLYYFANCFRYERPQAGRFREFWQMGCELIGCKNAIADAEVLNLAMDGLINIGLDFDVHIGHLGVLKGVLEEFNVSEEEEVKIRRLIDKEDYENLEIYLTQILGEEKKELIFEILKFKGGKEILDELKEILKDFPKSVEAVNNLEEILEFVIHDKYIINFGIARGLDYYTGMVFEIYGKKGAKQICGGGRYDNLIETFGNISVPAVGFAYGFDRIMMNIDDLEIEEEKILVIPVKKDKELIKESLLIANKLRKAGKIVEFEIMGRKLRKALDYANSKGFKKVIIVGEKELNEGKITLKDMITGEQKLVDITDLDKIF
ncbi:histidyl-tRNA synthetase [Methanocaldococcus vulcanius M7]|uniref:Histidine--tRNA ligase n=1 Tax=Methanocaldococcus vulcanius (strain ATCC 700851 / DSM 12094 / M7) TaxID=579137 RepID=C9RHV1_METVM|nr:histidine--tRNA ligase [Methanocaldococcus vulcanius]ACX73153.1 histidyl-tRNA synthetase [Methanocaldococcus vulcanius M7]